MEGDAEFDALTVKEKAAFVKELLEERAAERGIVLNLRKKGES